MLRMHAGDPIQCLPLLSGVWGRASSQVARPHRGQLMCSNMKRGVVDARMPPVDLLPTRALDDTPELDGAFLKGHIGDTPC